MKVWMVIATREEWPNDLDWDGPFVSLEYILNESIWADDEWVPTDDSDPYYYSHKANARGWQMYIRDVEVEGS